MTRTFPQIALVAGLMMATPALAFDPASMTDAERAAFGDAVRSYLLDNPEILVDMSQKLEERSAEAQKGQDAALVKAYADALLDDGYSWVGGNPEGDVTIVEFADYRCGYCRRAYGEVEELIKSDGNIRLIMKEFPILGEASVQSSRFAISTLNVAGADAYKAVHDTLITLKGEPTDDVLREIADNLDLDADAILAGMNSDEVNTILAKNQELAQKLQISGTPSFVAGDEIIRGYMPLEAMQELVADLRG